MRCFAPKLCGFFFLKLKTFDHQAPNYPDPGRCWDIVDKYKVTIFYTAPTLIRSLMRDGQQVRINFINYQNS